MIVLLLALLISFAVRVSEATDKISFGHDESISHLQVGCQAIALANEEFSPEPRPASQVKAYFSPSSAYCFKEIRAGLRQTDLHPPLYFWLLHVAVVTFGPSLWIGPVINALINLLTTVTLYALGTTVLDNKLDAALGASVYALSPAVVATGWALASTSCWAC